MVWLGQLSGIHWDCRSRVRPLDQLPHLSLELRFEWLGVSIRQRTMTAGVGVNLGAIQTDPTKTAEAVLTRDAQHLHEDRSELFLNRLRKVARVSWSGCRLQAM